MASRRLTLVFGSRVYVRAPGVTIALFLAPLLAIAAPRPSTPLLANASSVPSTIKNAPFSAEVSTQYDRVLSNGNHIHRETRGKVFRDAQGRVRTETQVQSVAGADSTEHIAIQDPVLREVIHLDSKTRTAYVHHLGESFPSPVVAAGKPNEVVVASSQTNSPETAMTLPLHIDAVKPPAIEILGTRMLEGVQVIGTRTTRLIPDGSNDAIVAVTETWFSRELQMVIRSISDDGQGGRSEMKVTNVVRGAPNGRLFQVPPDYTVRDGNPMTAVVKP